ncbi:MAG TPA: prepilin-type N-terminal cleavage/methylation domain-containing protein [Terriglobales bacterium]|nr:prepilin-type N-terminal cleavage/methylation domain-containing protein [Terriglobales bacterium]
MVRTTSTRKRRGFTLIELMMVISIILILVSVAAPIYKTAILHAHEAVLRDDLFTMRSLIQQYTLDKQKAPQALEDLVSAGYIKQIPKDPFTGSSDTWVTDQEDVLLSVDQQQPGIVDVHSGSSQTSSEGTAYSSW